MENTVNQRIILLKNESGLTNNEFCVKANISTGTLHNIQSDLPLKQKTINVIVESLGVSKEWLLTGKGNMFVQEQKVVISTDPWKDALVSQIKEENNRLQKEVERLWQMIGHYAGGAKPNFLKTPELASSADFLALVSGVSLRICA